MTDLIRREDAIELALGIIACYGTPYIDERTLDERAVEMAKEVPAHNGWIPVSDHLPDIGDTLLVSGRMKYEWEKEYEYFVDAADYVPVDGNYPCPEGCKPYHSRFSTWNDWYEGQHEYEILAWLPFPEPYMEVEEGEE